NALAKPPMGLYMLTHDNY
nr:tumorlytic factor, TF {internal fragment} [mice, C3H/HeJ, serum, Peptide Partial, 18 aa] [Mus sp.]